MGRGTRFNSGEGLGLTVGRGTRFNSGERG